MDISSEVAADALLSRYGGKVGFTLAGAKIVVKDDVLRATFELELDPGRKYYTFAAIVHPFTVVECEDLYEWCEGRPYPKKISFASAAKSAIYLALSDNYISFGCDSYVITVPKRPVRSKVLAAVGAVLAGKREKRDQVLRRVRPSRAKTI